MAGASDDTWAANVVKLLLTEFDGRAKLSNLRASIYRSKLMTDCGVNTILKKLKSSKRFLVFKNDGDIKYVSVCWEGATVCSHPRGWRSETCMRDSCSQFHVCKSFISGHCVFGARCLFGHTLQNEANKKVSDRLGLSFLSAEEIRTIIFRSHPAVCVKYNTGGCDDDDCPDLHVCSRFILRNCTTGTKCTMGHSFGKSKHNKWILGTFLLSNWSKDKLRKRLLVKQLTQCATSDYTDPLEEEEEETEDYISSVFSFLLKRFGGRTKFSTFLSERGCLFKRFSRTEIVEWFEDYSDRFLLYEKEGEVKYVSVYSKHARVCFAYNNLGDSKCDIQPCKRFHICKDFVSGCCLTKKCYLSHNCFSSWPYAEICSDLNHKFTNSEMCMIILSSNPAVCLKHNASGCHLNDCPDLHICSENILNQCTGGEGCKLGHSIRNSGGHNSYVLKAFRMDRWQEVPLRRLVIVERKDHRDKETMGAGTSPVQAAPVCDQTETSRGETEGGSISLFHKSPCKSQPEAEKTSPTRVQTGVDTVSTAVNETGDTTIPLVKKSLTGGASVSNLGKKCAGLKTDGASFSTSDINPACRHSGAASVTTKLKTTAGGKIGGTSIPAVHKASSQCETGAEKKTPPGIRKGVHAISTGVGKPGETTVSAVKKSPVGGHIKSASISFSEKEHAGLKADVASFSSDIHPACRHTGAASVTTKQKSTAEGKTGGASISPVHKATSQSQIETGEKAPAGVQTGVASVSAAVGDTRDATISLVKKEALGGETAISIVSLQESPAGGETGDTSVSHVKKTPAEDKKRVVRVSDLKKPETCKTEVESVSTAEKTPGHHIGSMCASPDHKDTSRGQTEGASISPIHKEPSKGQRMSEKEAPRGTRTEATFSTVKESPTGGHTKSASISSLDKEGARPAGGASVSSTHRMTAECQIRGASVTPVRTISTAVGETGNTTVSTVTKSLAAGHTKSSSISDPEQARAARKTEVATISAAQKMSGEHHTEGVGTSTEQKTTGRCKVGGESISPVHKTSVARNKSLDRVRSGVAAVGKKGNAPLSSVYKESARSQRAGSIVSSSDSLPAQKSPARCHTSDMSILSLQKYPDGSQTEGQNEIFAGGQLRIVKEIPPCQTGESCILPKSKESVGDHATGSTISPVVTVSAEGLTGVASITLSDEEIAASQTEVTSILTTQKMRTGGTASVTPVQNVPLIGKTQVAMITPTQIVLNGGQTLDANISSSEKAPRGRQTGAEKKSPTGAQTGVATVSTAIGETGDATNSGVKKSGTDGHTNRASASDSEKKHAGPETEVSSDSTAHIIPGGPHTGAAHTTPKKKTTVEGITGGVSISPVHKTSSHGQTEIEEKAPAGIEIGDSTVSTAVGGTRDEIVSPVNEALAGGQTGFVKEALAWGQTWSARESPVPTKPAGSRTGAATFPPSSAESHQGAVTVTPVQDIGQDANPYNYEYICETHTWTAPGTPLHFYTQWVWYRRECDGTYTPYIPGTLQYTLEEKYLKGEHNYYFEFEELPLMVDTHSSVMIQTNLDTQRSTKILRRPVFVSTKTSKAPTMSPLLLPEAPKPTHHVTGIAIASPLVEAERNRKFVTVLPTQEARQEGHGLVAPVQEAFTGGQVGVATVSPVPKASSKSQTSGTTVSPVQEALSKGQKGAVSHVEKALSKGQKGAVSHVEKALFKGQKGAVSHVEKALSTGQKEVEAVSQTEEASGDGQKGVTALSHVKEVSTDGQKNIIAVSKDLSAESQKGDAALSHVEEASAGGQKVLAISSPVQGTARNQMEVVTVSPAEGHRGLSSFSALEKAPARGPREVVNTSVVQNNFQDVDPSKYEYICETYTWKGMCPSSPNCPRYHSPDRLPYLWLVYEENDRKWRIDSRSFSLEKRFCQKLTFSEDFTEKSFIFERTGGSLVKRRRLSTPSYVTAAPGTPLHFYTQWVWYRRERDGTYTPYIPGALQYTLEEKYLTGQHKYYFEFEGLRLMVDTRGSSMRQTNLDTQRFTNVLRRPVFVSTKNSHTPTMSPLLLSDVPSSFHQVPKHWTTVDHFQDFELVELDSADSEYAAVQRQFFSTMNINEHEIQHIFRVQNTRLWYKYCCERQFMTPKGKTTEDVEERQLFHGTPTLQGARGICANSFDFRRSGENVGALYGRGAYFSTTARYSHSYTRAHTPASGGPVRFMFLGKVLVGQYTLGDPSYTKPPVRDGLKMYDSCVNNRLDPTIFVIFDLAQSYPEYLLQYTDCFDYVDAVARIQSQLGLLTPSASPVVTNAHPLSGYNQTTSSQRGTHPSSSSQSYCIIS